jgi:hypothetical protein
MNKNVKKENVFGIQNRNRMVFRFVIWIIRKLDTRH